MHLLGSNFLVFKVGAAFKTNKSSDVLLIISVCTHNFGRE